MGNFLPSTDAQRREMMNAVGVRNIEELYADIPAELRKQAANAAAAMPSGVSEFEALEQMKQLAKQNRVFDAIFRGAGAYWHHIPAEVSRVAAKEAFVTAYTPYQPEICQGILQTIFEYQTMLCELTGMDAGNASVYDGATAAAEAMQMVVERNRRVILIPGNMHPHVLQTMRTYAQWANIQLLDLKTLDGRIDLEDLKAKCDVNTAGVFIQHPNTFGLLEDVQEISRITHSTQAKLVQYTNPLTCAYLKSPRALGADIAIGETQSLGIPMSFGGPYLGFMAASADLVRRLPGRIAGQTVDLDGKRAFTLTLQAREQHIRREKASSSICSNQALMALVASM